MTLSSKKKEKETFWISVTREWSKLIMTLTWLRYVWPMCPQLVFGGEIRTQVFFSLFWFTFLLRWKSHNRKATIFKRTIASVQDNRTGTQGPTSVQHENTSIAQKQSPVSLQQLSLIPPPGPWSPPTCAPFLCIYLSWVFDVSGVMQDVTFVFNGLHWPLHVAHHFWGSSAWQHVPVSTSVLHVVT